MSNKIERNKDDFEMKGFTEEILFSGLSMASENVYLFKTDIENNYAVWSERAVEYFGLPEDYRHRMYHLWMEHVHPDDLEGYCEDIFAVMQGKKTKHYCQYRARNAEGKYVWVECVGGIQRNAEGKPFFVGVMTRLDVTGKYDTVTNCLSFQQFYLRVFSKEHSILLLGFDGFRKAVNNLGYTRSNGLLNLLGSILIAHFGSANTYRMTGDELMAVLPVMSNEELEFLFHQIQKEFKSACLNREFQISIGFSGGAAYYDPRTESKEDIIRHLEHSLEYSKHLEKESFTVFSSVIEEKHQRVGKIKYALAAAIKDGFSGFSLVYQPVFRSGDHRINGVEALLRFRDVELGNVSPVEFVPILEEGGMIREVGLWVAGKVMKQKAIWETKHPGLMVGFNVSLKQLHCDDFVKEIMRLIREYRINPCEVVLELTESCKMDDPVELRKILMPLREMGVEIYLDDFGIEQSNFTAVKELPITGVKIDHSFVRVMVGTGDTRKDRVNRAIVTSINYMCKQIGLKIVIEGVETEEIDRIVSDMDIEYLQGYHYSFPLTAEALEKSGFDIQEKQYGGRQ
ncbi:MAG: EAL domain-containing protein [Eubacteriales bacterium]|nr:EAL domain-containing protein [Eubacteriales bacterium]